MTSKISFSDLLRQDLRGRGWMAALSFLGNFLALPVLFLLARQRYLSYAAMGRKEVDRETLAIFYSRFFTSEANLTEGIILVGGAAIVAVFGFRYLYSRTMVDTYHSLPVSRTRLFFVSYLNGLLLWLIPFVISLAFTLLLALGTLGTAAYTAAIAASAIKGFFYYLMAFLIVYHLFLLAVIISGSLFSTVMSALIMGTAAAGAYELVCHLLRVATRTYLTQPVPENYIIWLSPLWSVIRILQELGDPSPMRSFTAPSENAGKVFLLAASLLLAAANLLAAWKMYLARPSELAERGIENKPLRSLLKLLGAYTAGLLGACLFLDLIRASVLPGFSTTAILLSWCLFAAVLACLITFGVLNMIFHVELRAFFHNLPGMGIVTGFTVLTVLCIALDWTGYDTKLPDRGRIISAAVEISGYNDSTRYLVQNSEGKLEDIPASSDQYGMEYKDKEALWNMLSSLTDYEESVGEEILAYAEVRLRLNGGGSFYRNYPIYQKDIEAVRPVLESDEYLRTHYRLSSGQFLTPQALEIRDENRGINYSVSDPEQIARIMDAYYQDFREHSTLEELGSGIIVATIQTLLRTEESSRYYPLHVYDYDTAVIQALKEQENSMVTLLEDLTPVNVKLSCTLNEGLSREALYSYFQLDGYPSYRDLLKEADSREKYAVKNAPASAIMGEEPYYETLVTSEQELAELLPYLHIGSYWDDSALKPEKYVSAGQLTDASGHSYTCYVEAGKLPEKWIDAMELVR